MMRPPAPLCVAVLVLTLSVSGCSGGESSPFAQSTPPPNAADPLPAPEFGSIAGLVTDDEKNPILGAQADLIDLRLATTTDDRGAFTFNDVPPGTFGVVVTRPGYGQVAKKVDVRAGEITEATFVLKPYVIAEEPYRVTFTFKAVITVGEVFVDNRVPILSTYCQGCDQYPRITPKPAGVMAEVTFTNGVPIPGDDVWLDIRRNWTNATGTNSQSDGTSIGSGYFTDRTRLVIEEAGVKSLANVDRIWYHSVSGLRPSINRRIDSYVSLAYHGAFPEGFTALPPP